MSELPLEAKVNCTDGEAGTSSAVVIDPVSRNVTHLAVRLPSYDQHVVPLALVSASDHDSITLACTVAELRQMPAFTEVHYVTGAPDYGVYQGEWESPYVTSFPMEDVPVVVELVPPGELAMHRGDQVRATDGPVGIVGEFVVDTDSGHISHLVLEKGHLWGKREVTLAMDLIDKVEAGEVYLKVDKETVKHLPSVKIKRHYRGG